MSATTEKSSLLSSKKTSDFPELPRRAVTVEFGQGVLSSMRLSRWYLAHCALLAILSIVLIILLIFRDHSVPPAPWLTALDGIIFFSLLIETSIDCMMLKGLFWRLPWHIFDFVVTFFSMLGFVILILEMTETIKYSNDAIGLVFGAIRYGSQVVRVFRYLIAAHAARQSQTVMEAAGDVTFPAMADFHNTVDFNNRNHDISLSSPNTVGS